MNSNLKLELLERHFPYMFHHGSGLGQRSKYGNLISTTTRSESNTIKDDHSDLESVVEEQDKPHDNLDTKTSDNGRIYHLDHAASTLYSVPILRKHFCDLEKNLYTNPHSKSSSSLATSKTISQVRSQVLQFFNTDELKYSVIFTQNASHACKIFAESFDWNEYPKWRYLLQCHNSLLGMREVISNQGIQDLKYFSSIEELQSEFNKVDSNSQEGRKMKNEGHMCNDSSRKLNEYSTNSRPRNDIISNSKPNRMIVAYPLECNSTGKLYPIEWIKALKKTSADSGQSESDVLFFVDAAKYASTSNLDLSLEHSPDFLCISFYKLFGYPTGVGALLVKNEHTHLLKKRYFSGGTVELSIAETGFHKFRKDIWEQFEDGTISFLDIIALGNFLQHTLGEFGYRNMEEVSLHTKFLAKSLRKSLSTLRHFNNNPVCKIYGWDDEYEDHGSILNFNLLKANGDFIGYAEVEQLANLHRINLRVGCFCNTGACQQNLEITADNLIANYEAGHVCWDSHDLIEGKPTGSVRVSFGYCSTVDDLNYFYEFIKKNFVDHGLPEENHKLESVHRYKLEKLYIYPIKSCLGACINSSWELSETGFKYDREWILIQPNNEVLVLKNHLRLGTIQPRIEGNTMILSSIHSPRNAELTIQLVNYPDEVIDFPLFGSETRGLKYPSEVNAWFQAILGFPVFLVRKDPRLERLSRKNSTISFSNEGQYLCITRSSLNDIHNKLALKYGESALPPTSDWLIERFRPNIVLSEQNQYTRAFDEDQFCSVTIGSQQFKVTGICKRCTMINVDTSQMTKNEEPLKTLFEYRKHNGRVLFGIFLARISSGEGSLHIGESVRCETNHQESNQRI